MKYYEYEDKSTQKIPYDKEPIFRQTTYKKPKQSSVNNHRFLSVVVCLLIIANIVLSGLVIGFLTKNKAETTTTTVNITTTGEIDVSAVASKAKLSTVCVHAGLNNSTTTKPNYQAFFGMHQKGSGVIFQDNKANGDAYIITCYHVIKGNTNQVYILLYDSFVPLSASMVYYSSVYDIAVLKISGEHEYAVSSATPAEVADSSLLIEGDASVAIGNPLGVGISVSSGIISKTIDLTEVNGVYNRVLRTEAPINGGNSGGGLFNAKGELIGIVNAKSVDSPTTNDYIDNVAYAIPSNVAISIAKNIVRNKMPIKAILNVCLEVDASVRENSTGVVFDMINGRYIPVQLVKISEEYANTPFEFGDVIVGFTYGDTVVKMTNIYSFEDHAFNINEGDTVRFEIVRDGKTKTIEIVMQNFAAADEQDWYAPKNA